MNKHFGTGLENIKHAFIVFKKSNEVILNGSRTSSEHDGKWGYQIGTNSYEKVKAFKYLDSIYEEIKCRPKVGN